MMNPAEGLATKATAAATSSGRPRRGTHWRAIWCSGDTRAEGGRDSSAGTWIAPGRTELTVIPHSPTATPVEHSAPCSCPGRDPPGNLPVKDSLSPNPR